VWCSRTTRGRPQVKQAFQQGEREGTLKVLTKHVIQPSEEEISANPRSRVRNCASAERV